MSIKNKIAPVYFQYDIQDTEMPECFFDKSAMTHMFFYELMDQDENGIKLDTLMIDENAKENLQFDMNFYGKVECWMSNNYSKQVQPFHSDNLAKTIAFQTEIRAFITEKKIFEKIKSNFCIFTFEAMGGGNDDNKNIAKYIVKEINEFKDRQAIRYAEIKLLQLNSNLIKSSQYWHFRYTEILGKRKIKQVRICVPFETALGEIKISGKTQQIGKEDELDYKIARIVHPFKKLEPLLLNFVQNDGRLLAFTPIWDRLGKSFEWLSSKYYALTSQYRYGQVYDNNTLYGSAGAAGYTPTTGARDGIGDMFCSGKDYSSDFDKMDNSEKAYIWSVTNMHTPADWRNFDIGKTFPSFESYDKIERLFKNINNTYEYTWKCGEYSKNVGPKFHSFEIVTLNETNFQSACKEKNSLSGEGSITPLWVIAGAIEFKHIFHLWKRVTDRHGYKQLYKNNMVLPWGLMGQDQWKRKIAACKENKAFEDIQITFDLPNQDKGGCYLTEISVTMLYGETLRITLYDELGLISDYNYYSNFYQISEDEIATKVRFS